MIDMCQGVYRHILIPGFETVVKRRKTFRYWKELERTQWLSREELEHRQWEALRRLLAHAFTNCPYYGDAWSKMGLAFQDLREPQDFGHWPVIDRETILQNRPAMRNVASNGRLLAKSTGGSSGVPLHFDYDVGNLEWRMAAWHRGYNWAGAAPGTKQLYLWGVALGPQPWWKRWKDCLYSRLYRRVIFNSFDLTEERVPQFLNRLDSLRPEVLVAYTNPLYSLARSLRDRKLKPYSPKAIVTAAEKIHEFQRNLIEEVFAAPVFETYGSREFTFIAGECDHHEGLHISMENLLVEILDDDGRPTPNGVEGNVVITDLFNFGMPFIRYANGDRALAGWGTCSCGRGLPLLKKVVGRRLDILETPDSRRIPGEFFPHLMKDYPAIKRFQVVQEQLDCLEIRIVVSDPLSRQVSSMLESEIRKVVGPLVQVKILRVDNIPLTRAGKLRVVISKCNLQPYDQACASF
jgi:phenylacetate-CoA ligase